MKLKTLRARSLRGIPSGWVDLQIGDRGAVIFGSNGVGKSSIVDAIEYAITGKSSLYPVSRQGVNWELGAPHVLGGEMQCAVEFGDGSGTFLLSSDTDLSNLTDYAKGWATVGRNASFVLRRHMLLRFISEEPKKRYDLLEPFLNLGDFQLIEDALKDWKTQLETELAEKNAKIAELSALLCTTFKIEMQQSLSNELLLVHLNAALEGLTLSRARDLTDLDSTQNQIAKEIGGSEQSSKLASLGALKVEVQRIGFANDLAELLASLVHALNDLEKETKGRVDQIMTDWLIRGKEAIEAAGLASCPLCEQPIKQDLLIARLKARIDADARITAARDLVAKRRAALQLHLHSLLSAMKQFCEHWQQQILKQLPSVYTQTTELLQELKFTLEQDKVQSGELSTLESRLTACVKDHSDVIEHIDGLIRLEGGGDRRVQLNEAASMVEAAYRDLPRYEAACKHVKAVKMIFETIDRLYGHAIGARKSAVGAALDEIADLANRYYETIHPAENLANSCLQVRETGTGSVMLSTRFHDAQENPLLHYSESHLDTLGLCYFLAIRKLEAMRAPTFRVLVLDDVMHSVDAQHRGRIADLVREEFDDHQIIVTTHDLHFFEALRRSLGSSQFYYGRISNWDLARGPIFGEPLTDYDRVMSPESRERISSESLSGACGRFFEWLLREATESVETPVPIRFKRNYEIGQLWPSLAARLRKQSGYSRAHSDLIDKLDNSVWVRNACGAHYNPTAAPPTDPEAQELAAMLAKLHDTLYCHDCHEFITRQKDKSWACSSGHLQYGEKVS